MRDHFFSLGYVPDWFVTQQQVKIWHDDDDDDDDDDRLIELYDDYQGCKTQKVQIKKELMAIACHPSRYWAWCMSEDEKKQWK